jgi:hypothetical protein
MDWNNFRQQLGYSGFTLVTCLSGIGLAISMRRRFPVVWVQVVLALVLEVSIEIFAAAWYSLYAWLVVRRRVITSWQYNQSLYFLNFGYALVFGLLVWAAFSRRHRVG